MILEMKVPSPGESITEVEIASWLVKEGDYVYKDQAIAEVDSDKATLELPAEQAGVIVSLKVAEGETIAVGSVVCCIDTSVETIPTQISLPKKKTEETKLSYATDTPSPAAKKILAETLVNPKGTGKDGRITKADALQAVNISMGSPTGFIRNYTTKKMSALRRKLGDRLVSVKNETAMLTTFNEVNMKAIMDIRQEYKDLFYEKHNVGLGFMSFFTKAVVRALGLFPEVNAMINGEELWVFDYKDISIAVSSPKGLMVPVVRHAENRSFRGIETEIKNLAIKARDGKLTIDDMTGGTFTITNGGVFGSMMSTPILNPPQAAILGMHNIVDRAVVIDNQIVIRPMMYLALSYDHRIIDGKESVSFLVAIKEALENPIEILMDNNIKKTLEL